MSIQTQRFVTVLDGAFGTMFAGEPEELDPDAAIGELLKRLDQPISAKQELAIPAHDRDGLMRRPPP